MKEEGLDFIRYVEVDFPAITSHKCDVIKTSQILYNSTETGTTLRECPIFIIKKYQNIFLSKRSEKRIYICMHC